MSSLLLTNLCFTEVKRTFAKITRNATHVKDIPTKTTNSNKKTIKIQVQNRYKIGLQLVYPKNHPKYLCFFQNGSQEGPQILPKSAKNDIKNCNIFLDRSQDTSSTILKPSCPILAPFSSARGGLDLV